MIKVYRYGKLFKTFEHYEIKNMNHVQVIWNDLCKYIKIIVLSQIPKYCEEPMQYIMRENGFTLESF